MCESPEKRGERGFILLAALLMLTALAAVVFLCLFVLGAGADNDLCYLTTCRQMLEAKRALVGGLADVSESKGVAAGGGFINDFGEPVDPAGFTTAVLLSDPGGVDFPDWRYNITRDFWSGYRGERYLNPGAGQSNPDTEFLDGWGFPVEVDYIQDTDLKYSAVEIGSKGSDGAPGGSGNYTADIKDTFYVTRPLQLNLSIKTENPLYMIPAMPVAVELIHPFQGKIQEPPPEVEVTVDLTFGTAAASVTFSGNFPVGSRKAVFRGGSGGPVPEGSLLSTAGFCIPPCPVTSSPPAPPSLCAVDMEVVI
jgi:hypothetical protein